jgi:hypothetical protein
MLIAPALIRRERSNLPRQPEGTSGKQPWRLVGYFERFT